MRPLAIDLYCGLGGWTDGLLLEGYECIGYDIEEHAYGEHRYRGRLVIQDVLMLHGSKFRDAALIVASPPCQEYSYMAMPWKLAKAKAAAIRADTTGGSLERLNRLFDACFRIQKEASIAAGRHIPLVVENVRGAQPWVGRARWNFGSFYLWGDVPAPMPQVSKASKNNGGSWFAVAHNTASGKGKNPVHELAGIKVGGTSLSKVGFNVSCVRKFAHGDPNMTMEEARAAKNAGHLNKRDGHTHARHLTSPAEHGTKNGNDWFGAGSDCSRQRRHGSKSKGRKMASAMIAKIPLPLSRHVGAIFRPLAT